MHSRRLAGLALTVAAAAGLAALSGAGGCAPAKESPTDTPTPTHTPTHTPTPVATPVVSTAGEITTFDWGTISLPAGSSPAFSFTVPANSIDVEFLAVGAAADANSLFVFFSASHPGGQIFDNGGIGAKQAPEVGSGSFALPSDDGSFATAPSGAYSFHVAAYDSTGTTPVASHPRIMAKVRTRAGGVAINNILDINLVIVQGARVGLDGSTAQSDTEVQNAVNEMNALYSANGINITLGTINYYDLATPSFADLNSETELYQLLQTSASLADDAMPIYIIHSFGAGLGNAAGIAGGIPVTMGVQGTLHAGVAVALQGGNGVATGDDMAHETGHALGLYHTSEFDGTNFDPIADTIQCPSGTMQANPASCPDIDNVMFPQLISATKFTAGQGTVIRPAISLHSGATFAPIAAGPFFLDPPREFGLHDTGTGGLVITCSLKAPTFHGVPPDQLHAE